jgi:cyclophilin family peptidyl-prolyl cis-trans isomerase
VTHSSAAVVPCPARRRICFRRAFVCLGLVFAAAAAPARAQIGGCTPNLSGAIVYVIKTPLGDIPVELYPNMAPQTVANFRAYADAGDWDGSLVHRSVPGFVIQGGGYHEVSGAYQAIATDPPVPNEPCLSNTTGTIAMARIGGQPNSATSQWFVNLANNTSLDSVDGGFTAFGRVIGNGMSVVQSIAALPIFDALAYLQLPFNQIFRSLPLFTLPLDPPGGYGCSRAAPVFGLYAEPPASGFIVDSTRSGSAVVPILLDPQCTGAGAVGPPDVPCSSGRQVYEINLPAQQVISGPYAMSCNAVSESEDSWAARRTGTNTQVRANDFAVISVPEPSLEWSLAAGISALALLVHERGGARRSRRGRRPAIRRCQAPAPPTRP